MSSGKSVRFDGMGRIDGRAERPYVMVDRELIELLEPDELALYVVLLSYLRSPQRMTDRELWPSQKEIARVYGRSVDTVQRVMKRLIARGLVHETQREGTSNLYRLAAAPDGGTADLRQVEDAHQRGAANMRYPGTADLRHGDTADPRNEVEEPEGQEGKDKNPVGAIASLSPPVPRDRAEREDPLIAWAMREYGASAAEIEHAWEFAEENGMQSKRGWLKSCPEDVAKQLREVRQTRAHIAAYEARLPLIECEDCGRPMRGAGGPLCRDCREEAA